MFVCVRVCVYDNTIREGAVSAKTVLLLLWSCLCLTSLHCGCYMCVCVTCKPWYRNSFIVN